MCREFPMASFLQGNSCTFETPFFFLGDQAETKTPNGRPWQQQNIVMAYYALLFTAGLLLRLSVTRFSVAMVTLRPQNIQKRATTYAAALHNHPFEILLQDGFLKKSHLSISLLQKMWRRHSVVKTTSFSNVGVGVYLMFRNTCWCI